MISRPPLPPPLAPKVQKIALIVPSDLIDRVDDFRKHLPGLPNRSIALRQLIERGLASLDTEAKPGKKRAPKA
jgi:hypothetical protein